MEGKNKSEKTNVQVQGHATDNIVNHSSVINEQEKNVMENAETLNSDKCINSSEQTLNETHAETPDHAHKDAANSNQPKLHVPHETNPVTLVNAALCHTTIPCSINLFQILADDIHEVTIEQLQSRYIHITPLITSFFHLLL